VDDILVVGAGGQGKDVLEIIEACNLSGTHWKILGFLDDSASLQGSELYDYKVLGGVEYLNGVDHDIAVNLAIGDGRARRAVLSRVMSKRVRFPNLVHPSSYIGKRVVLGAGNSIHPGVVFSSNCILGSHVIVNVNATLSHDVILEDFVTISPGAHINGRVEIKAGTFVGSGAVIREGSRIGKECVVAAGAAVLENVPDNSLVAGVPAILKKSIAK
jgi:sugar O-acyltransferase (sialic acid O-acetyltransferase NeuD family)